MPTIDDIRIKLDVDASKVASGIKGAFRDFDAELRKSRVAQVTLSLKEQKERGNSVDDKIKELAGRLKKLGEIPLDVKLPEFDAATISDTLSANLEELGGVPLPFTLDTKLNKEEAATTRQAVSEAIGVVTLDWQLAPQPKNGWPEPPPGWGGGFGPPSGGPPGPDRAPGGPAPVTPTPAAAVEGKKPRTEEQIVNDQRLAKAKAARKQAEEASDDAGVREAEAEIGRATEERNRLAKDRRLEERSARKARARDEKQVAEAERAQTEMQAETPEPKAGIGGRRVNERRAAKKAKAKAEEEVTPTGAPVVDLGTSPPTVTTRAVPPARGVARRVATTGEGQIGARPGRSRGFRTSDAPRGFGRGAFGSLAEALAEAKRTGGGIFPSGDAERLEELDRAIGRDESLREFFDQATFEGFNLVEPINRPVVMGALRAKDVEKLTGQLGPTFEALRDKTQSPIISEAIEEMAPRNLRTRLTGLRAKGFDLRTEPGQSAVIEELANQQMARRRRALSKGFESLATTNPDLVEMVLGSAQAQAETFSEQAIESGGGFVNRNAGARPKDPVSKVRGGGEITAGAVESAQKQMAVPIAKRKPVGTIDEPLRGKASTRPPRERPPKEPVAPFRHVEPRTSRSMTAFTPEQQAALLRGEDVTIAPTLATQRIEALAEAEKKSKRKRRRAVALPVATPGDVGTFATTPVEGVRDVARETAITRARRIAEIRRLGLPGGFIGPLEGFAEGGALPGRALKRLAFQMLPQSQRLQPEDLGADFNPFMAPDDPRSHGTVPDPDREADLDAYLAIEGNAFEAAESLMGTPPAYNPFVEDDEAVDEWRGRFAKLSRNIAEADLAAYGIGNWPRSTRPYEHGDLPVMSRNAEGGKIEPRAEGGLLEPGGYSRGPGWRRRLNAARLHLPGLVESEAAREELGKEPEQLTDVLADIGGEMQTTVPRMADPDWPHLFKLGQSTLDDLVRAAEFPFSKNAEGGEIKRYAEGGAAKLPRWLFTEEMPRTRPNRLGQASVTGDTTSPFWKEEARDEFDLATHDRLVDPMSRFDASFRNELAWGMEHPYKDPDEGDVRTREMEPGDILPFSRHAEGGKLQKFVPLASDINVPSLKGDALEEWGKTLSSFERDFPRSARTILGLQEYPDDLMDVVRSPTAQAFMGTTGAYPGFPGMHFLAFRKSLFDNYNSDVGFEKFSNPSDPSAFSSGTNWETLLSHELGHVVDAQRQHALAARAAQSPPVTRYGAKNPLEAGAEAFSLVRTVDPKHLGQFEGMEDFADLAAGISEHEKLLTGNTPEAIAYRRDQWAKRRLGRRAEGGEIKHTGLLGRMIALGTYQKPLPRGYSVTQVGERGPELIVQGPNGEAEVVPTHQVPTFLSRTQKGRLPAKELTYAAEGRTFGGGPFQFRGVTGSLSADSPQLSRGTVGSGTIQRVFVVNWPTAFTQAQPAAAATKTEPRDRKAKAQEVAALIGDPIVGHAVESFTVSAPKGPLEGIEAVAAGQPEEFILPSKRPSVQAALRIEREQRLGQSRLGAQAERAEIAIAQAESPVRAFTTAFSQVVQTLAGRGDLIKQAKEAQQKVAEAQRVEAKLEDERFKLRELQVDQEAVAALPPGTPGRDARLATIDFDLKEQAEATRLWGVEVERAGAEAAKSLEPLGGLGAAVRNLAVGGASAIVAGVGFTAAFAALNTAVGVGTAALGVAVERTFDYRNATAELTKTLAEQARQNESSAEAATAAALAQSGLNDVTAESVGPLIAARAAGVAGNQAFAQQTQQIAAAKNIGIRPENLPAEFDTSLVRSTGGPFDLGLLPGVLSQPSLFDELALRLDLGRSTPLRPEVQAGFQAIGAIPFNPLAGAAQGIAGAETGDIANILRFAPGVGFAEAVTGQRLDTLLEVGIGDNTAALDNLNTTLDDINKQAQKGGFGGAGLVTGRSAEEIQATFDAFAEVLPKDSPFLAQLRDLQLEGRGVAFTGGGNAFEALQFGSAIQRSGLRPSPQQLINQLTARPGGPNTLSPLDATLRDITRRGAFQRETIMPAQQALAFAARPLPQFSMERLGPTGVLKGDAFEDNEDTIGQYQEAFDKYAKFAEPAQEAINAQIAEGRKTLQSWIGPELLGDITDLGAAIQDIQLDIGQRGLNLEVSQYNNEIRIASRQLQQAKDFTAAIKGNVKDTIGGLQGQNYQLGRQLQLLQQEIQQRQINFQLAIAGFVTAGDTPEQRAARIEQAKLEAEYAQKQLDLSKQISSNEFSVGLKENANAVTDLTAQIALLREGKALAIDSFAAEQAIKAMEAELQILEAEAQERFEEQVSMSQVELGIIHDIERETGEVFDKWQGKLIPAFRDAGRAAGKAATDYVIASIASALGASAPEIQSQFLGTAKVGQIQENQLASGILFNTSGPTDLTVGEAGSETVAVLRNPRPMQFPNMGGMGGGGMTVQIVFNNPRVRSDGDLQAIVQKVQEAMNNQARLLGLR